MANEFTIVRSYQVIVDLQEDHDVDGDFILQIHLAAFKNARGIRALDENDQAIGLSSIKS